MTHLFYFRLLTSFLANGSGKFDLHLLCGDIELNLGPSSNSGQSFSICRWNLNIVAAHNFSKNSVLKAYNVIHTYECLNFSLSVYGKQCNITLIYRSPSQLSEEFDTFLSNFELLLDYIANHNPFVSIINGDFNARSNNWCPNDKTTYEGQKPESLTSQGGFKQVISDPTHILECSLSCIDLIFTSQPNLIINSGVHSSLHRNCHHQIIHAKFNLKIFCPPPYERVVWHYQDANNDLIQQSISQFNWETAFSNKGVKKQISIFNETILNIMTNFIPHETKKPDLFNSFFVTQSSFIENNSVLP